MVKFFTKVQKQKEIDTLSHTFVQKVFAVLEEHGLTDKRRKNECFLHLLKISTHFYRVVQKSDLKASDEEIQKLENECRGVLAKYGVTDESAQEEIITQYFIIINELGEQKNGIHTV